MEMSPKLTVRSRNRPPRTMAVAASVAMVVADVAAMIAMVKLFHAASLNFSASGPVNTSAYQRRLTPSQLVIELLSLSE